MCEEFFKEMAERAVHKTIHKSVDAMSEAATEHHTHLADEGKKTPVVVWLVMLLGFAFAVYGASKWMMQAYDAATGADSHKKLNVGADGK